MIGISWLKKLKDIQKYLYWFGIEPSTCRSCLYSLVATYFFAIFHKILQIKRKTWQKITVKKCVRMMQCPGQHSTRKIRYRRPRTSAISYERHKCLGLYIKKVFTSCAKGQVKVVRIFSRRNSWFTRFISALFIRIVHNYLE